MGRAKEITDSFCFSKQYGWNTKEVKGPDDILYYRQKLKRDNDFMRTPSDKIYVGKYLTT